MNQNELEHMNTYRVWVSGYVDIKAWTPEHARHRVEHGIIHYDKNDGVFVCLHGPMGNTTIEESPK